MFNDGFLIGFPLIKYCDINKNKQKILRGINQAHKMFNLENLFEFNDNNVYNFKSSKSKSKLRSKKKL